MGGAAGAAAAVEEAKVASGIARVGLPETSTAIPKGDLEHG